MLKTPSKTQSFLLGHPKTPVVDIPQRSRTDHINKKSPKPIAVLEIHEDNIIVISDTEEDQIIAKPKRKRLRRKVDLEMDDEQVIITPQEQEIEQIDSENEQLEMSEFEQETLAIINSSTVKELMELFNIEKKLAQGVKAFCPFKHISDIYETCNSKIEKCINKYIDMLERYKRVDDVVLDCEKVTLEINNIINEWSQGKGKYLLEQQPEIIEKFTLKKYQLIGVSWLALLYKKKLGGILADEMGLGKTAQVISFISYLYSIGDFGPHLIIVPSSTLGNWEREFSQWCPTLEVHSYHGTLEERTNLQYLDVNPNVVLTTYNMATGSKADRSYLRHLKCKSLILDEGHFIKNASTQRFKYLMSFKAQFRLLLTGTPLQNNLGELLSLLLFIMPTVFAEDSTLLQSIFAQKTLDKHATAIMEKAKRMMQPFILRRRKDQVLLFKFRS